VEQVRRGGEVAREKFTAVRQGRSHGLRKTAEVDGIEEDIGILRE
jgi:hypothetical protein